MTAPEEVLDKEGATGPALARLLAELRRNKRALGGVLLIVALLAGYGMLMLDDATAGLRAGYLETGRQLDRLRALAQEKDWTQRAADSTALRRSLEQRLWQADSEGVARADLQDWVTNAARAAGLERLQVTIDLTRPKELPADLRQVTARITGAQSEAALEGFLDRVGSEPRLIVVERLHAQQHPFPLLEMTLASWAKIAAPSAATVAR
jgi:hypothetical protein